MWEMGAVRLYKAMENHISTGQSTCPLCLGDADDIYVCETCGVGACGGCIGRCEDCETALVCCECFILDDEFDPWCPRCAGERSLAHASRSKAAAIL